MDQILGQIEDLSGSPPDRAQVELQRHRQALGAIRSKLVDLEEDVHKALVSLCTDAQQGPSSWSPEAGTSAALQEAWAMHEGSTEAPNEVMALAESQGNPWLWVRAQADLARHKGQCPTGSDLGLPEHFAGLPSTACLFRSAMEELGDPSRPEAID
jgi:hypothetical protein